MGGYIREIILLDNSFDCDCMKYSLMLELMHQVQSACRVLWRLGD